MSTQNTTRMTIDIPHDEHRKLKAIAALRGITMKAIILECLSRELYSENIPNEATKKVFQESDRNKNITYYDDLNQLREKLGL